MTSANVERGHAELEGEDPTITFPEQSTLFKRLGLFAIVLLIIYLVAITQVQARQNGRALDELAKNQERTLSELHKAEESQEELLRLLSRLGIQVTNTADTDGDGDLDFVVSMPPPSRQSDAEVEPVPAGTENESTPVPPRRPQAPSAESGPADESIVSSAPPIQHSPAPILPPALRPLPQPEDDRLLEEFLEHDSGLLTEDPLVACANTSVGRTCL